MRWENGLGHAAVSHRSKEVKTSRHCYRRTMDVRRDWQVCSLREVGNFQGFGQSARPRDIGLHEMNRAR